MPPGISFVTAASYTLVFGLFVQTAVLSSLEIVLIVGGYIILIGTRWLWYPAGREAEGLGWFDRVLERRALSSDGGGRPPARPLGIGL